MGFGWSQFLVARHDSVGWIILEQKKKLEQAKAMIWFRWYVRRKTRPGDQGQLLVEWTHRWVRHPVTKKYIFISFSQWKQANRDEDIFEHVILRWKFRKGANWPFWHQVIVFLTQSKTNKNNFLATFQCSFGVELSGGSNFCVRVRKLLEGRKGLNFKLSKWFLNESF